MNTNKITTIPDHKNPRIQHKRQKATSRHVINRYKHVMHIQYSKYLHPLTTFQVQVRHKRRRAGLPRETTYVIVSRDDVRDCLERRRAWSPRETTYVAASRDNVRGRRERRRAWLPRETTNVIIMITVFTVSSSASRCCDGKWLITNLKSLVKASYSNRCSDTPK